MVNGAGSPPVFDVTGGLGTYSLTGFGSGSYTVTPSKSGGQNGSITSFDAAKIAQFVVGTTTLNATQQSVGDVSGNGGLSSFDAGQIASYAVSLPNSGLSGNWKFIPVNRTYPAVTTDITGEDYAALLMGEVSGNWTSSVGRTENGRGPETEVEIKAQELKVQRSEEFLIPVTIENAAAKDIISYQFDLRYDPSAITPAANPVNLTGTVSRRFSVAVSTIEPGLLRVAVYGADPISEDGTLLNLRFRAAAESGFVSTLKWERVTINEDISAKTTDGRVEIVSASEVQAFALTGFYLDSLDPATGFFSTY